MSLGFNLFVLDCEGELESREEKLEKIRKDLKDYGCRTSFHIEKYCDKHGLDARTLTPKEKKYLLNWD